MLPLQDVILVIKLVVVVSHLGNRHHALHRVGKLHVHAPASEAGDLALVDLAEALLHVLCLLLLVGLALCLIRSALHGAGLLADKRQDSVVVLNPLLIELPVQVLLDDPVDLGIRIPANRGREVAVILQCQAIVTAALRRVLCPLHGAEDHGAEHGLLGCALDLLQEVADLQRGHLRIASLQLVAVVADEGAQALNLLLQGLAVGAVHKWDLLLAERLCHSLVCRDHEVLDHLRCIVALVDADVQGLSVLIQNDL